MGMIGKMKEDDCDLPGPLWRVLTDPHPVKLAMLVFFGILLEGYIHYILGVAIVYTHFFYLIIVIAGLWYGRRAIWIALLFGGIHIAVTDILSGFITLDSLFRALMFCVVAFVVGTIAEQRRSYQRRLLRQNRELLELNNHLHDSNQQLEMARASFATANRKLNLLSSVTRHDIKNQLTALLGYVDLMKHQVTDPAIQSLVEKEEQVANNIVRQVEFTKNYEDLGLSAPVWQDVAQSVNRLTSAMPSGRVRITTDLDGLEAYADPLLEKVWENLIDNSIRHGERVTTISFTYVPSQNNAITIVYEDDGAGIEKKDKEKIFERGYGKNTGLGLFLIREILAITTISIRESGTFGKGARFEILVPDGKYRFPNNS